MTLDITDQRFGMLVAIRKDEEDSKRWVCECDCGITKSIQLSHLRNGQKSCGCLNKTHGMSRSGGESRRAPEYTAWANMITRCYNNNNEYFTDYGGRGITVCDQWRYSFEAFYADMGQRPTDQHSLDRYPNMNGNYEPGNCRWATLSEQHSNTRRNVYYEYQGEQLTQAELARRAGIPDTMFRKRIKIHGHTVEDILSNKPVGKHVYTYNGETKSLSDWAKYLNISYSTLYKRLTVMNLSFEEAIKYKNLE